MPRTDEQRAADDALTAAIEQNLRAYADELDVMAGSILTEYIVIVAGTRFTDDGDGISVNGFIPRDGDVTVSRLQGLIRWADGRLDRIAHTDDD